MKKANISSADAGLCSMEEVSGMDRRQFMERALAAGLTVSAASSLWSRKAQAETPKKGGLFRVGADDGNTTDSNDPATYESQFMINMAHTHRNFLTEITEDNVVGPELAESWEATPDAATWTFKLRQGVEFHNGKSFTAQDAVATLNYHRNEGSKSAAKALLESVEEIKADDDHTLTVRLKSGSADFPYVLTDYHLVMLPSDGEGNADWRSGVGTGGYVIKEFNPGVSATLERFPNYFKEGRAHFDEVHYAAIADVAARISALRTGELEAVQTLDLNTLHLLERDPGVEIDEVPSGTHNTMAMHVDVPPYDSNDVRLALKLALDREDMLKRILKGHGTIGNDHPIGPVLPYFAEGLEQRVYDPEKAKWHLKQAGQENLQVTLSTSNVPMARGVDFAVLYKEHAAKAGIDVQVAREPEDGYWSNVWLKKPFSVVSWGQRPTPDVMFTLAYSADAAWNETHFKHERFNQLLLEARAELDDARRAELYYEMQQIVRDEGGTIVPFFSNYIYAHRKSITHGPKLSGNWPLDGSRAAERWWFA